MSSLLLGSVTPSVQLLPVRVGFGLCVLFC